MLGVCSPSAEWAQSTGPARGWEGDRRCGDTAFPGPAPSDSSVGAAASVSGDLGEDAWREGVPEGWSLRPAALACLKDTCFHAWQSAWHEAGRRAAGKAPDKCRSRHHTPASR